MAQVAHKIREKSRTGDVLISENIDFNGLLLSDAVLNGLQNAGFVRPSPIQLKAIPLGRCGLDLIVQAKSGTGKTCVFSVIALESIATDTVSTQVLVLAPTREIAVQIWEVINSIGSAVSGLECHMFIGGLPLQEDRMKLRKCHIAVGSPGRIKQLIESGVLKTDSIRLFVLDEADKLLEESFQEQINWIYSTLPDNKQMLALSATYPEYLATHLTAYMRNPTYLRLNITDPALLGIRQYYQTVPFHPMAQVVFENKSKALVNILSSVSFQQCLVFSNLQTRAQTLADSLVNQGWPTACIAGCLDQKDRNEAMAKLKTYKCRILISTDLTSRGIDADKVSLVINLDVPKDHETYLHRIGRAGRFGAFGIAITLVSDGQENLTLNAIEKCCNTQIFPLPDPLPCDLAKAEARLFLEDVVSTEVINTDGIQETAANLVKASGESASAFIDSEGTEKSTNTTYNRENTADQVVKSSGDVADELDTLEISEKASNDKKDILEIPDHKTNVNDLNGPAGRPGDNLDGKCVLKLNSEGGDELKSMGGLEETYLHSSADSEITHHREVVTFDDAPTNRSATELLETGGKDKEAVTNITRDESTEFDIHLVTKTEALEEGLVCTEQTREKTFKQNTCNIDSQDVHKFEAEQKETKERERFYLPEAYIHSGYSRKATTKFPLNCEKVSLPQIFKHSIGYKAQSNPHTYNAGQNSLRTFLLENCASKTPGEKSERELTVPEVTVQNEETKKLRTIVDDLQDLFDKNLRVEVDGINHVEHVVEKEQGTKENGRAGPGDLFVSQYIKKTNTSFLSQEVEIKSSTEENISDYSEQITENKKPDISEDLGLMLNNKKQDITNRESKGFNEEPNGQGKNSQKPVEGKFSSKTTTEKQTAGKDKVVGYQGKFSIGHFLDVERQKAACDQGKLFSVVNCQESETKGISSGGENVIREVSQTVDTDHFKFDQVTVECKHQAEGRIDRRNLHQVNMKLLEKGQPSTKRESESDQVISEHSGSDFTEDSDLDSTSSSDSEELKKAGTTHKIRKSGRDGQPWLRSETSRTQHGSYQNWHETRHNPYGTYHETDSYHYNQSYDQFSSHQSRQLPRQQFAHYPNYWLPWFQYYGYHGYPQSQYTGYIPSHPYFGAPSVHGRTFNQTLEATHRMQKEYIKAMCKMNNC